MSNNSEKKHGVVILGHGSRLKDGLAVVIDTAGHFQERFPEYEVTHAFMELSTPTLEDAVGVLVDRQLEKISILPLFLSFGHHISKDLPKAMEKLENLYPGIVFERKAPIGAHPMLCDILYERMYEK